MPATARIALSREARAIGRLPAERPPAETARLWADVLGAVPLFAEVSARQVRKIARLGSLARFDTNDPIVSAGNRGDAFYVILSGRAKVLRSGRTIARLGPGSYFGEMSLIDGAPRSATIIAETETTCLMLTRTRFGKIVRNEPAVGVGLLRTLAARVRKLEAAPAD